MDKEEKEQRNLISARNNICNAMADVDALYKLFPEYEGTITEIFNYLENAGDKLREIYIAGHYKNLDNL